MPDEFLISGEALIHNLQIGMAQSLDAGADPQVLYLPDTFGHISQLPQIARQLGLKSIVVARGVNQPAVDLHWTGPDGSRIHTHALPLWSGYYQDFIHLPEYVEKTKEFLSQSTSFAKNGPVILFAGADHTMPPADWAQRRTVLVKALAEFEEGWTVIELDLNHAMALCRDALGVRQAGIGELTGELRDNSKAYILSGVASSRADLKLLNVRAQALLSYQLDPLGLFAPADFLYSRHRQFLWKTLIQNHAHDSIGGCSIDQVHRENRVRFESVIAGAERHSRDIMRRLVMWQAQGFNNKLFVWNLLPFARKVNQRVILQIPKDADLGSLRLVDENGLIRFAITQRQEDEGFYSEFELPPGWNPGFEYRVDIDLDLAAFEVKELIIEPILPEQLLVPQSPGEQISDISPQNDSDLQLLEDILRPLWEPDLGDTYTSSPNVNEPYWGKLVSRQQISDSGLTRISKLVYQGPGKTLLILMPEVKSGEDVLRIGIRVENCSEDMRLRLILGTAGRGLTSQADIPLDVVTRTHRPKKPSTHEPQRESYPNEWPSQSFITAAGMTVYHRGLHGYDLTEDGRIALTILRSVGMLSRGVLPERGGGAGPHISTPDAQMPGTFETQIAIGPNSVEIQVYQALLFNQPISYCQGTEYKGSHPGLRLDNPRIIPVAIFRPENEQNAIIIRMLNTSDSTEDLQLHIPGLEQTRLIDLVGRSVIMSSPDTAQGIQGCGIEIVRIQGDEIYLRLGKKNLCTLECRISRDVMV